MTDTASVGSPPVTQTWDPSLYDRRHSFVYTMVADMLKLLDAQPGERIIDLGCGTGVLTADIAKTGASIVGLDLSAEMIDQARRNFPELRFEVADAAEFTVDEPVDAVFSNAALHWVRRSEDAVRAVARALRPGGRFVAEFGGHGCVQQILEATSAALGQPTAEISPWYFPTVGIYAPLLERHGFEVRHAALFDRPTPLEDGAQGLRNWLRMFAGGILSALDQDRREEVYADVEQRLRPSLWKTDRWVADYRRIRIVANKL
ncbi:MAG: methyltransferase domain-containing protein [Pirellulales bacterium]|nr:methyltransferase domain-containing protein [Pirellulales bacterium]